MSKPVKALMQNELETRFKDVKECLVVSVRGITGNDNNDLRGSLQAKQMGLGVVKNSLARRAFENLGLTGLGELFSGPCAVAYGGADIVELAKEVADWAKKLEPLEIKGGFLDGEVLEAAAAIGLAKMPSRAELQGAVVMLAKAPGSRLAGAIGSPAGRIAGCVKSLVEKLEDAEAA